jgi:hypothetical protein
MSSCPVLNGGVVGRRRNLLVPFNNLLERVVITVIAREAVRVDERAERVTALVARGGDASHCGNKSVFSIISREKKD